MIKKKYWQVGSKMSLVGLCINVYLAFLKDKMEIILEKWWKLSYVILKGSKGERKKGKEKDGTVNRYIVPMLNDWQVIM